MSKLTYNVVPMNHKKLTEKLALLKAGQIVEIDGLSFSAKKLEENAPYVPCYYCNVDCLCRGDVTEVCKSLDFVGKDTWYLFLES